MPALACLFLLTFGAGETTVEAELPKRSARIVDYSIDARLVPETQSVEGRQKLTWRNTSSAAVERTMRHGPGDGSVSARTRNTRARSRSSR